MNRFVSFVLPVVAGGLAGTLLSVRPATARDLTLYGELAKASSIQGPLTFEFSECTSGQQIATLVASPIVKEGGFVAHLNSPRIPDGVYALSVKNSAGEAVTADSFVNLQTSTPGTQQVGHINIDGTLRAGRIGVGIAPTIARIQVEDPSDIQGLRVRTGGTAILGQSLATTGTAFGGQFFSSSKSGRAVFGQSLSPTGNTRGGLFQATSPDGIGLVGQNLANTGNTTGVLGEALSPSGTGVLGKGSIGLRGQGETGVSGLGNFQGVNGEGLVGVAGITRTPGGTGVFGEGIFNGTIGMQAAVSGIDSTAFIANNGSTQGFVELGSKDGAIVVRRGFIKRVYKSGAEPVMAVPLAYGVINANGTVESGSGNFTAGFSSSTKEYSINIDNYDEVDSTTVVLTPYVTTAIGKCNVVAGRFRPIFIGLNGSAVAASFSFIIFGDPALLAGPPSP